MSAIFLDPVQMDATAGAIGQHAREAETLVVDLESACSAVVPPSLAGWLADELRDIAVHVRMVALLYTVAALDTALRAQQIQADQSLATAAPSLASTSSTFTGAPLVGGFGAFGSMVTGPDYTGGSPLVGGTAPFATSTATTGFTAGASIVGGFFLGTSGPNTPLGGYTPALGGSSLGLPTLSGASSWPWNSNIANILAPSGLSAVAPGVFEDETGRQGGLGRTYRDPRTGDLRF